MSELAEGQVGSVGKYDVEFKDGKLMLGLSIEWNGVTSEVKVGVGSDAVIDALKAAIPGKIDDAILEVVKAALKMVG